MARKGADSAKIAELGKRIKELRQKRDWSQRELAERVGVQQKQISSYERGANMPSGEIFIALADAFDVSLDYLTQRTPGTGPTSPIADLELLEKAHLVDRLGEEERTVIKQVMELAILKGRFRTLVHPSDDAGVVDPDTVSAA